MTDREAAFTAFQQTHSCDWHSWKRAWDEALSWERGKTYCGRCYGTGYFTHSPSLGVIQQHRCDCQDIKEKPDE